MKTLAELERQNDFRVIGQEGYLVPVNAACSKCGCQLLLNTRIVLTTFPEQYQYLCEACGNVETSYLRL